MIDKWSVLDALKLGYAHSLGDAELLPYCEAAAQELSAKLREDADVSDVRLLNAAAATANYTLAFKALSADDGITAFKAGDVSITKGGESTALQRKQEALLAALPLLKDDAFVFTKVEI